MGAEHNINPEGQDLLLFYLVLDESYSMAGEGIDTINRLLPEIHEDLRRSPAVSDVVRMSIIGFADTPETLLELADLGESETLPGVSERGGTEYGLAFDHLRSTIERDVAALKADGASVRRPVVFFLSDGEPTDDHWRSSLARLTDKAWPLHPNIISFGIGDADAQVIAEVATLQAYMVADGVSPGQALSQWSATLLNSIMASATAGALMVPEQVEGFTSLAMTRI